MNKLYNKIERLDVSEAERTKLITLLAMERFRAVNASPDQQKVRGFDKYKELGAYHWDAFEKDIRSYNAPLATRYKMSMDMILRNCAGPGVILDIGCGDGVFTKMLAEKFKDAAITGFDMDETAIRLAKEKTKDLKLPGLSFVIGDALKHTGRADLIVSTDVIEHLHKPDEFMAECFDTLNPGGHLFLSTPIRIREVPTDIYHTYEFYFDELEAFSSLFGFSVTEHTRSHDYSYNSGYNRKFRLMGIGRERYYHRLYYNFLAIYLGRNVFEEQDSMLPLMQYILLKKPDGGECEK